MLIEKSLHKLIIKMFNEFCWLILLSDGWLVARCKLVFL